MRYGVYTQQNTHTCAHVRKQTHTHTHTDSMYEAWSLYPAKKLLKKKPHKWTRCQLPITQHLRHSKQSFDVRSVTICRKKDTISKKKQVGVVTYSFNSSSWASEAGRSL